MSGDRRAGLTVVVLSCGPLGRRVASSLIALDDVDAVALVTTPYRRRTLGPVGKMKHVVRYQGWRGLVRVFVGKLRPAAPHTTEPRPELPPGVAHARFDDFHAPDCLEYLENLEADLGVLAGTYILRESVFGIPRLGCINLHTGKVPEYRGAAPAFWELYNGETEVGVTVHEVTADLDAGRVLLQEVFALDPAPEGDPMDYIAGVRSEVLLPNGVRMLTEGVRAIASGTAEWRTQDVSRARTYRTPDRAAQKELRKRIEQRRRAAGSTTRGGA
ncbi:MAG: formyltransferase family protein [Gemmatimonadota bacterium]|nr:formyltransferase family protein [Gemmatimonadota bacterium]